MDLVVKELVLVSCSLISFYHNNFQRPDYLKGSKIGLIRALSNFCYEVAVISCVMV